MAKADVVAEQKAAVIAGQDAALEAGLESCYDQGVSAGGGGGFSQADIDAAVAAAKAVDAQAMSDAVAAVQAQLDAMTSKDNADVASIAALQEKIDQIKALLG